MTISRLMLKSALLCFLAATIGTARGFDPALPVSIAAPPTETQYLQGITDRVYHQLDFFFGSPAAQPLPRIMIGWQTQTETATTSAPSRHLLLNEAQSYTMHVNLIARQAIMQRIIGLRRQHGRTVPTASEPGDIAWLAAAVTYGVLQQTNDQTINLRPDYRAADSLFRQGHFPSLPTLVNRPVNIDHQLFFPLYAMQCHLLLSLVRGPVPTVWRRSAPPATPARQLLKAAADGETPEQALETVIGKLKNDDETMQEWYQARAPAQARRTWQTLSSQRIVEELFAILTIVPADEAKEDFLTEIFPEISEDADERQENNNQAEAARTVAFQRQPLAEFNQPQFWRNYPQAARQRLQRLQWLHPRTPPLLQPPIETYRQAIMELSNHGPTSRFKQLLQEGDQRTSHALERQRSLEQELARFKEAAPHYAPHLDRLLFIPVSERQQRTQNNHPQLHELLDRLEAKNR